MFSYNQQPPSDSDPQKALTKKILYSITVAIFFKIHLESFDFVYLMYILSINSELLSRVALSKKVGTDYIRLSVNDYI